MRIATWNMEGKWSPAHSAVLDLLNADIYLLTEMPTALPRRSGNGCFVSELMAPKKYWAAVLTTLPADQVAAGHPASAAANIDGLHVCSSVLAWNGAGRSWPWPPADHAGRVAATLETLSATMPSEGPVVWGGDFNVPLAGPLTGYSNAGRRLIAEFLSGRRLQFPTADLPRGLGDVRSIDHISVPAGRLVRDVAVVRVEERLSDHHAYVIDVDLA